VRRFGINALSSLAARLLSLTVLVWVNQHLLKRIDAEEYSLFPLVMSLLVFSDLFVAIFVGGIGRHMTEAHHRGDHQGVTRITSSMLCALAPVTALLALAGGLAAWNIDGLLELAPQQVHEARLMLLLVVAGLCFTTLTTPLAQGLYVRERFVTDNLLTLGAEVVRMVLLLSLLFALGTRVLWLVVASSTATITLRAAQIALSRSLLPAARFRREAIAARSVREVLAFGAWTSVHGLGQLLTGTLPLLILNRFASAHEVATFHAGRLPDLQLRSVLSALEGPAQPALIGLYAREGKAALDALYYRGGRYFLWVTLLPVAPLLACARPLYRLYAGAGYESAGLVMIALLASYPLQFASAMYYRVAHAIGQVGAFHRQFLLLQVVALAALTQQVVVADNGAVGAALALGVTYGLGHLVLIWPCGLRLVAGRWREFARQTLARGLAPFAASLGASFLCVRLSTVDSWSALVGVGVGATLVYLAVLYLAGMDTFDRGLVAHAWRRLRPAGGRHEGA